MLFRHMSVKDTTNYNSKGKKFTISHDLGINFGAWQRCSLVHAAWYKHKCGHLYGFIEGKAPEYHGVPQLHGFQHDSAPAHSAHSVRDWIASQNIEMLSPWPVSYTHLTLPTIYSV